MVTAKIRAMVSETPMDSQMPISPKSIVMIINQMTTRTRPLQIEIVIADFGLSSAVK